MLKRRKIEIKVNLMGTILGCTGRLANILYLSQEKGTEKNILILKIFNAAFHVFIDLLFFDDFNISFD